MASIQNAVTIADLQKLAHRRLPKFVIDYVEQGAGSGGCVRGNIDVFAEHHFAPKALAGHDPIDTSLEVFSQRYAQPFGISAVGVSGLYRRDADKLLAEAARDANVPYILSGSGASSVETIAKIAPDHTWYQLYPAAEERITDDFIDRAGNSGVKTLVVTIDYPEPNRSEVKERTGVSVGRGPTLRTFPALAWDVLQHPGWLVEFLLSGGTPELESWRPYVRENAKPAEIFDVFNQSWCGAFGWDEIERIRGRWSGNLVIKGVLRGEDVERAVSAGADAVTISNHGGNKLERAVPSLMALSKICQEQKNTHKVPLFFDGGIRRGEDILTALAVGASFCFVGRATLYGVAAGALTGANRALEILAEDARYTLAMIGCRSVRDLDDSFLF